MQPEARVDVLGPRASVQPGIGIGTTLGTYVRVSAAAGYALEQDERWIDGRWRGDLLARFTLDPFRQQRWGFAVGGGLSLQDRPLLALFAELEGPVVGRMAPAVQIGLSGGVRGAVVLRRAVPGRR